MLCVRCWHELASTRAIGMHGAGSIPWTAIKAWGEEQGLDRPSRRLLYDVIAHVENERIRKENAKAALNRATGGQ